MTTDNADLMGIAKKGKAVLFGESDDIPAIMRAIDMHVIASSYGEAFPNVIFEAISCKTPVIVSKAGDTIVGDFGVVTPPLNAMQLSAIADNMFVRSGNISDWLELGQNSKQRVAREFDRSKMTNLFTTRRLGSN